MNRPLKIPNVSEDSISTGSDLDFPITQRKGKRSWTLHYPIYNYNLSSLIMHLCSRYQLTLVPKSTHETLTHSGKKKK